MTRLEMMHIAKQRAWGTSLLTLCPQIKVPLITVCLDVLKYTSCQNGVAFLKLVGIEWCSALATRYLEFTLYWFISALVRAGHFPGHYLDSTHL